MGSRTQPNHGGSGYSHSRKSRPKPEDAKAIRYGKIETLAELELYLSGAKIACLLCGKEFKMLGRHLGRSHAISARQYKEDFNIPVTRSLSCADLREQKRQIMKKTWAENPKMEGVRESLKANISRLDGTKHKTKSSIPSKVTKARAAVLKQLQSDTIRIRFRAVYMEKIAEAILADVTLYTVYKKTHQVYAFAERNPDDIEFINAFAKVKKPEQLESGKGKIELVCVDCGEKYMTRVDRQAKNCGCKRRAKKESIND